MKKILSLFLFVSIIFSANSQTEFWDTIINAGSTSADYGYSITTDSDKNIFITGSYNLTANFGDSTLTSRGSTDAFIAKLNPAGDALVYLGLAGDGPAEREAEVSSTLSGALEGFSNLFNAAPSGEFAVFLGQGRLLGGGVVGQTISMLVTDRRPDEMPPMQRIFETHRVGNGSIANYCATA